MLTTIRYTQIKLQNCKNENRYSAKRIDVDAYKPLKE